jgi:Tfp pilus assembly protein PilO
MSLIDHGEWTRPARIVLALLIGFAVVALFAALLLMHAA